MKEKSRRALWRGGVGCLLKRTLSGKEVLMEVLYLVRY